MRLQNSILFSFHKLIQSRFIPSASVAVSVLFIALHDFSLVIHQFFVGLSFGPFGSRFLITLVNHDFYR